MEIDDCVRLGTFFLIPTSILWGEFTYSTIRASRCILNPPTPNPTTTPFLGAVKQGYMGLKTV